MIFTETKLSGAFLIDLDRREDVRGYFARVFCVEEFRAKGLSPQVAQCSISFNRHKGTLRGMHWQAAPKAEAKLIRVTRGAIHDVIVDLRPDSPTRLQHITAKLSCRQWTHALHPGRVCAWVSDLGRGHRGFLPDDRIFRAGVRSWRALE